MKQKLFFTTLLLAATAFALPASAVEPKKGEVPASLCITAETQKMHAGTVATYEKDIAAYKDNAAAQAAIAAYKEKVDAAWSALEQPYCGYGSPTAIAATKKSYNKTVVRARSTFQEAVKNLGKANVAPSEPIEKPAPEKVQMKLVETAPKSEPRKEQGTFHSGLSRGQRSDAVLELQTRLAKHFKLADPSSIQTGYFGPKTEKLVIKFQLEQQIIDSEDDPGAGLVGPKTFKALLSV